MIAAIASPSPTRPRAAPPTRNTTPISTANAGTCQRRTRVDIDRSLVVGMKDLLDSLVEEPGDLDRERQGRAVPAGLDRVDGLPRHGERLAELALRELTRQSQFSDAVPHVM